MSKEYGLIIPSKNKMTVQAPGKRAAIFDEDSDSDETSSKKPIFQKPLVKKQTKLAQDKVLEEDPTVYQYDEIYDDMVNQKNESKLLKEGVEKKPKYITNLLKAAERRKRENERRIDRQVQKEREAEGDEFKDKESFVTPSYQKKLEEMKLLEEQEKREEYLEAIGDVKKQGNLDGFYRHFYDQKVNHEVKIEDDGNKEKEIIVKKEDSSEEEEPSKKKNTNKRQYRKREESHSEDEMQNVKKEHIPSNLDADSDFSIDSSDSEEEKSGEVEPNVIQKENEKEETASAPKEETIEEPDNNEVKEEVKKIEEPVKKKPKIDIYKKRTVGEVFEAARQRYFERCSLRESG